MEHFSDTLIPAFGWLVLVIFALATLVWAWRIVKFFIWNKNEPPYSEETLGLPKGTVRSFIVISFSAIMFLIFFGDVGGIPAEDRKWFLTAYSSVLAFYFGTRYFPGRFAKRGLAISRISPPIGKRPTNDTSQGDIHIEGSGFESPRAVTFTQGRSSLVTSRLTADSQEKLKVAVELAPITDVGPYDVTVDLANGSRIVYKSGFTVE